MGVYYSAVLFLGIPAKDTVEITREPIFEKKFKEDSGEPYQKNVGQKTTVKIGNTTFEHLPRNYDFEKMGMRIELFDYNSKIEKMVLGVVIADTEGLEEITPEKLESAKKQLWGDLEKIGIPPSQLLEPKIFLIYYAR